MGHGIFCAPDRPGLEGINCETSFHIGNFAFFRRYKAEIWLRQSSQSSRLAEKNDLIVPVIGSNTKYESRSTGELVDTLGMTPPKQDRDGNFNIKIGFSKPRKGTEKAKCVRNAMLAGILEYGESLQPPKPNTLKLERLLIKTAFLFQQARTAVLLWRLASGQRKQTENAVIFRFTK